MAIGRPISLTPNIATKAINSVATANQTDFTVTGGYRINELAVYRNGVRLAQGRDFTANDGTTVTLTNGATLYDVIEFVVFDSFNVADAIVSVASSQTVSGDLNVTGKFYSGSIDPNSLNAGVGTITRISNTSLVATSATVSSAFHVGSALTANAAGDVESIGIITAASFSGDGSSLTNVSGIVTSNIVSVAITTKDINVSAAATITGALTGSTGTFSGAVNVDATTDSTSSSTGALIVDGGLGVAKNVYIGAGLSVAGTLTYEDVTNVDSVGLITAKSGVNVTGGQLQVGVAYSVGAAGVATAAGFVGPLTGNVTGAVDLNGGVLTLDADADTTITADTDDQIDIAFGGSDRITLSTGLIDLKNSGSQSALRLYCESSNAHYTALQAAAHSAYSGNATVTLPASTDTLVGRDTTDTLTNKTLSAPSITGDASIADKIVHTGDTNTAIRFPAADTFTVETGGSERVRVDSNGKVGIGTDNPDEVLSLFGSANNVRLRIDSQNLKRNNYIGVSAADNLEIAADEDNAGSASGIRFRVDAAERARFNASGNLGIGTVTPARRLHLHEESSDTVQLHITNSTTGVSGSDGVSFALGSDESLIINQRESNSILLKTADTERLRIRETGNVFVTGAGSTSLMTLYANETTAYNGSATDGQRTAGATLFIENDGNSNASVNQIVMQSRTGYEYNRIVTTGGSTPEMAICVNDGERLRINSSGFVGINTDNPSKYLHIVGNDGATGATPGNSDTQLVIDNKGSNGSIIEFLNDTNGAGHLAWTDTAASNRGVISYLHSSNAMTFGTNAGTTALTLNSSQNATFAGTVSDSLGNLRSIPVNSQSGAYVLVAADAGKAVYISTGGVTINNSLFSTGDAVTIINNSGSDQTITQGSGFTLYNTADASTGNRTLAGRGMATVWFSSANGGYISGAGLS